MTKAYEDQEFMASEQARSLRILSEYIQPKQRFEEQDVHRALIFWGSARIRKGHNGLGHYIDKTQQLAKRMAQWTLDNHEKKDRYYICTGGGPGIMQAANQGAAEVDKSLSIGFGIQLPRETRNNPYLNDQLGFEFKYFFMRKFWFMNIARALVVFPGGFGTMDELFEMLTLIQTKKQDAIPVVLYGKAFWNRLIDFNYFAELGLIDEKNLELIHITDDIDEAYQYLINNLNGKSHKRPC